MALNDPRVQLLANLKLLYGSNVEVVTLCVDAFPDNYQAVAMNFDPFTATWTKFLHSRPNCTSTRDAIETLLGLSERELAKLLAANGNAVPFQGIMVQTLTLRRGLWKDSSAGSSVRSECVFVATPGLTLSDTIPDDSVHREHPVEEAASKEPSVDETPIEDTPIEDTPIEDTSIDEATIENAPVDEAPSDEAPAEEAVLDDINKEPLAEEPISILAEPGHVWDPWNFSGKDKKKKKARFIIDESQPVEEYPTEVPIEENAAIEVCSACDIAEEVLACYPEPDAPPPEHDIRWGVGSFTSPKKDKKKQSRYSIKKGISSLPPEPEQAVEPVEEVPACYPEPAEPDAPPPEHDFGWGVGSFTSPKKDKKKQSRNSIKKGISSPPPEPEQAVEPVEEVPACYPEPAEPDAPPPEHDFGWGVGSFTSPKKDKKKQSRNSIKKGISSPPPEPEQAAEPAEEFGWGSFSTSKKKKTGKPLIEEEKLPSPELEPVSEPVEESEWSFFIASKKAKKGGKKPYQELQEIIEEPASEIAVPEIEEPKLDDPPPAPPLSESQPRIDDGAWETLRPESPFPLECVGHPTSALSLTAATFIDITTDTLQPQVARIYQTVVFRIQFPNEISNKPLQVMTTIAGNTRTAIIDTLNSYLDSKSMLKGMHGQRKLEIKHGVGRNGDVDLSALEETMWPEYLDYFRQYTRIPELTVDVVD